MIPIYILSHDTILCHHWINASKKKKVKCFKCFKYIFYLYLFGNNIFLVYK